MAILTARNALTVASSSRAGRCVGLAALALLAGNESLQNAVAEGDTRTISLHHIHTGEDLTITYKRNGRYDADALKKINWALRDWRRNEEIRMEPRLIDIVWEVNREVGGKEAIQIIGGYRAPQTNAMLRRRSRGVAQFSQHTLGKAIDFYIPGAPLEAQREAGLRLQRGGVGYYPTSGSPFVHLDVGSVRHWPRMTHDQLARVFPNGRTVHIPSDGRPLSGYALALADVEKHGSSPSQMSLDAARNAGIGSADKPRRSLLAALFGGKDEDEDRETAAAPSGQPPAASARTKAASREPKSEARTAPVPLPTARPARLALAHVAAEIATVSANNVISSRGYWESSQTEPAAAKDRVQVASADSKPAMPARLRIEPRPADLETTGALAPWPVKAADDRVPHEIALAYAAQADVPRLAEPVRRAAPMGASIPPNAGAATLEQSGSTIVVKTTLPPAARPSAAESKPTPGTRFEDPWLRALLLAPDLQNFMTATLSGAPDLRELHPLMLKPDTVVMMTFSNDPHLGMTSERFSGSAVVFMSTVTFTSRTAMLRWQ